MGDGEGEANGGDKDFKFAWHLRWYLSPTPLCNGSLYYFLLYREVAPCSPLTNHSILSLQACSPRLMCWNHFFSSSVLSCHHSWQRLCSTSPSDTPSSHSHTSLPLSLSGSHLQWPHGSSLGFCTIKGWESDLSLSELTLLPCHFCPPAHPVGTRPYPNLFIFHPFVSPRLH